MKTISSSLIKAQEKIGGKKFEKKFVKDRKKKSLLEIISRLP